MSDNLVLEHLRAIRGDLAEIKTSIVEVKQRLGLLEAGYASLSRRVDAMDERLERIGRRIDLTEAAP